MMRNMTLLLLAAVISFTVNALETVAPYRLSVIASGDATTDQRLAFEQMIVRLTGSRQSLADPLITRANPSHYLQQYSFQAAANGQGQRMVVLFNEDRVNQLLIKSGQKLWGKQRPVLLAWYVTEDGAARNFMGEGSEQANLLHDEASKVAIPLRLPVMDLDDMMSLTPRDVWGNFDDNVFNASQRYAADLALMVKHYQIGDEWVSQWRVLDLHQRQSLFADSARGLINEVDTLMWEQLSEALAGRYAVTVSTDVSDGLALTFTEVANLAQFKQLESNLVTYPSVAGVVLKSIKGQAYTFNIQLLGPWNDLQAALALDKRYLVDSQDPFRYALMVQ
jgi:hypothetical protein